MVLTCMWTTPSGDSLFNDHPFGTFDAWSGRRPPHQSRRFDSVRAAATGQLRHSGQGIHSFLGAPLQAGGSLLGREYALIDRAGLLNETRAIEVTLRDELYNFAHFAHHSRKFRGSLSINDRPHPLTRGSGSAASKYLCQSQVVFSGRRGAYRKSASGRGQREAFDSVPFCITGRTRGRSGGDTGAAVQACGFTCHPPPPPPPPPPPACLDISRSLSTPGSAGT